MFGEPSSAAELNRRGSNHQMIFSFTPYRLCRDVHDFFPPLLPAVGGLSGH